jgi:hypothetical protein
VPMPNWMPKTTNRWRADKAVLGTASAQILRMENGSKRRSRDIKPGRQFCGVPMLARAYNRRGATVPTRNYDNEALLFRFEIRR